MARSVWPERSRPARSSRQLSRFDHSINSDRVFGTRSRFARLFRMVTKADLLILDDWGPDRLNPNQRRDLMEIVEDRYGAGSTLITSQLPVEAWHDVIDDPTLS